MSAAEPLLRPAADADAAAMHELTRSAYQRYVPLIGREPAPMLADYARLRPPACAWVADAGGAVVGLVVCEVHADHLLVENLAVEEAWRGRGLGGRLLARAEQAAWAAGLPEVRLYTNAAMTENIAYYPRRGYRETHRTGDGGLRRVHFTKPAP